MILVCFYVPGEKNDLMAGLCDVLCWKTLYKAKQNKTKNHIHQGVPRNLLGTHHRIRLLVSRFVLFESKSGSNIEMFENKYCLYIIQFKIIYIK